MVIEHSTSYWSLLCGLKWESVPSDGYGYKSGAAVGPRADHGGRITLRLYGSNDPKDVGYSDRSTLLETRAWMAPGALK